MPALGAVGPLFQQKIEELGEQMVNRREVAQRFIQAQIEKRTDIRAAWVVGSVARGEDTESSDIDIVLVVAGVGGDSKVTRGGIDAWLDGIYIEAGLAPETEYTDLAAILQHPVKATHLNDALILYDPSGRFTELQEAVRAVFMQPQWLAKRLTYWLAEARIHVANLQQAIAADEPLAICQHPGLITYALITIPLLRIGITPSSSRSLLQLSAVSASLQARIVEFEGASTINSEAVLALEPLFRAWMALVDPGQWGSLGEYFARKTVWMARQGFAQAAVHAMWPPVSGTAQACSQDKTKTIPATALAARWLSALHWDEPKVLETKAAMAIALLHEMETLVTDVVASTAL